MNTLYYIIIDGRQAGPYPKEVLLMQGLTPETYVWREGLQGWVQASQLPELDALLRGENVADPLRSRQPPQTSYDHVPPTPYMNGREPYGQPTPHTNWLPWSIVATIAAFMFSCIGMIFGIIGMVQANKANTAYAQGDEVRGDSSNSQARLMTIIAFVFAAIGICGSIYIFNSSNLMSSYQQLLNMH